MIELSKEELISTADSQGILRRVHIIGQFGQSWPRQGLGLPTQIQAVRSQGN